MFTSEAQQKAQEMADEIEISGANPLRIPPTMAEISDVLTDVSSADPDPCEYCEKVDPAARDFMSAVNSGRTADAHGALCTLIKETGLFSGREALQLVEDFLDLQAAALAEAK